MTNHSSEPSSGASRHASPRLLVSARNPERRLSRDHPRRLVVDRLEQRAVELHEAAQTLAPGDEREGILQRARRMEAASNVISRWYPRPAMTTVIALLKGKETVSRG